MKFFIIDVIFKKVVSTPFFLEAAKFAHDDTKLIVRSDGYVLNEHDWCEILDTKVVENVK